MAFLINKQIVFSSELKQLSLYLDSDSYVVLSNPATRLIMEFLQKNGVTLSREHLLKHVWEDYGSTPSNNNLYMAVSELRKAFRILGMTDTVISTIPKAGFLFEAEIEAIQINPLGLSQDEPQSIERQPFSIPNRRLNLKLNIFVLTLTIILVIIAVIVFHMAPSDILPVHKRNLVKDFGIGKCSFYTLGKQSEEGRKWVTMYIQTDEVKSTLNINCNKIATTIYYQKMSPPINETFLSACTGDIDTGKGKCKTLRTEND